MNHVDVAATESIEIVACECGEEFFKTPNWYSRMKRHAETVCEMQPNKRRHYCYVCDKNYSRSDHLRNHLIDAHGIKPLQSRRRTVEVFLAPTVTEPRAGPGAEPLTMQVMDNNGFIDPGRLMDQMNAGTAFQHGMLNDAYGPRGSQ